MKWYQIAAVCSAGAFSLLSVACGTKPGLADGLLVAAAPCSPGDVSYQRDIAPIISARCSGCHGGDLPRGGVRLESYDDVRQAGRRVLGAIEAGAMPPSDALPADQVDLISAWVDQGMCDALGAQADAGKSDLGDQTLCSSGQYWPANGPEGAGMNPGMNCVACHASEGEGPRFSIAGTVYDLLHSPDRCYGVNGASVIVTDATGQTVTMTSNGSGNFFSQRALTYPISAKVRYQGGERVMVARQSSGNCASCHSAAGADGAPGRIVVP